MGKPVTTPTILLDNTILSNFALIGRIDLIYSLWPNVACTTMSVLEEYQAGTEVLNMPEKAWEGLIVHELSDVEIAQRDKFPLASFSHCACLSLLQCTIASSA